MSPVRLRELLARMPETGPVILPGTWAVQIHEQERRYAAGGQEG